MKTPSDKMGKKDENNFKIDKISSNSDYGGMGNMVNSQDYIGGNVLDSHPVG